MADETMQIKADTAAQRRAQVLADHRWLNEHRAELAENYADRFVAIHEEALVAVSADLLELDAKLKAEGFEEIALIAYLESPGPRMGL